MLQTKTICRRWAIRCRRCRSISKHPQASLKEERDHHEGHAKADGVMAAMCPRLLDCQRECSFLCDSLRLSS